MKYSDFKALCAEALLDWGLHSDHCVELLAMIAAHESLGGKHRRQLILEDGKLVPKGKARGLFGIEPVTHNSVWDNSDTIKSRAARFGIKEDVSKLETDDRYSIWVARHYLAQDVNPLPKTPEAMAAYCKSYWNRTGKATPEKYLNDYRAWQDGRL
jgi:hypothetical protein